MRACAVVGILNALLWGAQDQHRAVVVTHDHPDVYPLWLLYGLVDLVVSVDATFRITGWVWAVTVAATAVAFVGWLVRARRNADRLTRRPRWGPNWAIGGWLVPVANLVLPYLVIRDVDRASAPGPEARTAPVGRWWVALLLTMAFELTGVLQRGSIAGHGIGIEDLVRPAVTYLLWAAGTAVLVYTAVAGVRVVRQITAAQEAAVAGPSEAARAAAEVHRQLGG